MRENVELHQIRSEVQIEAGISSEAGNTAYSKERLNHMINQTERLLAAQHTWPLRHYEITGTVAADGRYTAFPTGVTPTSIRDVRVLFGDQWLPMNMGITPGDRSIYNETMRSSPAQKWDINVARPGQFEIWPISSSAQTLLFRGQRVIGGMVQENDTCVLDADALVLTVASVILAADKSEIAAYKARQASDHIANLMKQITTTAEPVNLGRRRQIAVRPGIDFIPPGGA